MHTASNRIDGSFLPAKKCCAAIRNRCRLPPSTAFERADLRPRSARADFDKNENAAVVHNQIDLAARASVVFDDQRKPAPAQKMQGARFGGVTGRGTIFGGGGGIHRRLYLSRRRARPAR